MYQKKSDSLTLKGYVGSKEEDERYKKTLIRLKRNQEDTAFWFAQRRITEQEKEDVQNERKARALALRALALKEKRHLEAVKRRADKKAKKIKTILNNRHLPDWKIALKLRTNERGLQRMISFMTDEQRELFYEVKKPLSK